MKDYIILDGKRYKTTKKSWRPDIVVMSAPREFLDGSIDQTFGTITTVEYTGDVIAPNNAISPWGSLQDIDKTVAKQQAVSFTDHMETSYASAHLIGPFRKRALAPDWNAAGNPILVRVKVRVAYG